MPGWLPLLGRARIRAGVGVGGAPGAPLPAQGTRPVIDGARTLPVQPEHVEADRRGRRLEGARTKRHLARDHRHVARPCGGGRDESESQKKREDSFHGAAGLRTVPEAAFADKGTDPLPNTILTPVKTAILLAFLAAALALPTAAPAAAGASAAPRVLAVHFDNDVNPVTADYLTQQIDRANRDGYDAVVIVLDTPGGLSESMRKVYQRELASKIPVIVYVAPEGARAASAGVWIGQAADVLAMAPQTNIGSSTPISVGGANIQSDLRRKVVNDAAASLRALARTHGRNANWADSAVRKASNLTADEALKANVIDAVAPTLPALLRQLDGYKTTPKGYTLELAGAQIDDVEMSLWKRILDTLIDPNIITLLLSIGALGIIVEMWNPGLIFPGTVGAICLVLGLFGLSVLPVSAAGVVLMLLAAFFFVSRRSSPATARSPRRASSRSSSARCSCSTPPGRPTRCRSRSRSRSRARSASSWGSSSRSSSRCGASRSRSACRTSSASTGSCATAGSSSSTASSGARTGRTASRSARARTSLSRACTRTDSS